MYLCICDQDDVLAAGPPSTPGCLLKLTRGGAQPHISEPHTLSPLKMLVVIIMMMVVVMMLMMMMTFSAPVTGSTLNKSYMHSLSLQYKQLLSNRESLLIKHFDLLAVIRIGGNFMGVRGVEWGMSITIAQV